MGTRISKRKLGRCKEVANTRKIESPEMLEKHIHNFIKYCEESQEIPSAYNLCKFLAVSASTLERYERGEGTYKGYDAPLKTLRQYREHCLLRMLEDNPKQAAAAIFQLKQSFNGGYTEGSTGTGEQGATVTLRIEGVGGSEAFK